MTHQLLGASLKLEKKSTMKVFLALVALCGSVAQETPNYSLGGLLSSLNSTAQTAISSNANFKEKMVNFSNTTVSESLNLGGRLMNNVTEAVSSGISLGGNASLEIINHGRNIVNGVLGVLSAVPLAGRFVPTSFINASANLGFNIATKATQLTTSAAQATASVAAQTGSSVTGALNSASGAAHDLVATGQQRAGQLASNAVNAAVNKTSSAAGIVGSLFTRFGNVITSGSAIPSPPPAAGSS